MNKQPADTVALSEDFTRKAVENSVDGLLVIDQEGIVRFANPAALALFADRTSELVGFQLGAPAIHEPVEVVLPGSQGARYVEMRAAEIAWEGRLASLASLRDITDRKRAEEALLAQAEDLRQRNSELMRFNRAAAGREMRMIELKVEVNELCRRLGEDPRYGFPADAKSDPALKESGQ